MFLKFAIRCVCHLLNVEPGEDDVSAWGKLHGTEFKGDKIPFGALVYFKPSGARANEQAHKFDPKASLVSLPVMRLLRRQLATAIYGMGIVRYDEAELFVQCQDDH